MGLHWITEHTILLRSLTLGPLDWGHNGLHLLSTQLLATAAIKRYEEAWEAKEPDLTEVAGDTLQINPSDKYKYFCVWIMEL